MTNKHESGAAQPSMPWGKENMLAWCEENNMRPCFREMERWYYVEDVKLPGGWVREIKALEGIDASALRKLIRGELKDYIGWEEAKMDRYKSWLRSLIRRGMTDDRYAQVSQRGLL